MDFLTAPLTYETIQAESASQQTEHDDWNEDDRPSGPEDFLARARLRRNARVAIVERYGLLFSIVLCRFLLVHDLRALPSGEDPLDASLFDQRRHFPHEAIAATRHGLNEVLSVRRFAKHLSQLENILRQVRFLDECVRPQPGHQLVLRHQRSAALNQGQQCLEHFWRKRDRTPRTKNNALGCVQPEFAELVTNTVFGGLFHPESFLRTS